MHKILTDFQLTKGVTCTVHSILKFFFICFYQVLTSSTGSYIRSINKNYCSSNLTEKCPREVPFFIVTLRLEDEEPLECTTEENCYEWPTNASKLLSAVGAHYISFCWGCDNWMSSQFYSLWHLLKACEITQLREIWVGLYKTPMQEIRQWRKTKVSQNFRHSCGTVLRL